MSLTLERIVPWGRTADEYRRMFALTPADLADGVLDCGAGPAGFVAEVAAATAATGLSSAGLDPRPVVAVDPLYAFTGEEIGQRFAEVAESIMIQVRAAPERWCWSYHGTPEGLLANRRSALTTFLADYEAGRAEGRYVAAQLPNLPFADGHFGLALSSHLLFLYSDLLTAEFHVQAVRELGRVAREIRIFPLLNLDGQPSPHVPAVESAAAQWGWPTERVRVDYELQPGGNQMLRILCR